MTPQAFDAVIRQLGPWLPDSPTAPPVALAVSGGGDSMALAWLASRWRRRLVALIVDHGLRPESGGEAALTGERLNAIGVPFRILTLHDLRAGSGLAHRARTARYDALTSACRELGCLDLLLGHQADDQAETIAMRARRGGASGLAGMAWVTETPDLRLIRPLLGVSRAALRQTLRLAAVPWVDDPSNEDRRAERVRVRQELRDNGARQRADMLELGQRQAVRREELERAVAEELARSASLSAGGWVVLGDNWPTPEVLAALLRMVGGAPYPPARDALLRLHRERRGATLAGARLVRARVPECPEGGWVVAREAAAMEQSVAARPGVVWDGRFRLDTPGSDVCDPDMQGVRVAAAGLGLDRRVRGGLPAVLCATLPALWRDGRRVCVPHLGLWEDASLKNVAFIFQPHGPATASSRWIVT